MITIMIKSCRDVDGIFRLLSDHGHLLQAKHVACLMVTVSSLKHRLNNQQKAILDRRISYVARFMNLKQRQDTLDSYLKLGFEGGEYTGFSPMGMQQIY
jgi:hypothetical protein